MSAATESSTIVWKDKEVRYVVYQDGQTEAERRVYFYSDIIEASGSSILSSFIFRNNYPQFFGTKGNNLLGLMKEVVSSVSEIAEEELDKEYRKVIDEFCSHVKVISQVEETGKKSVEAAIKLVMDAVEGGPDSKAMEKLKVAIWQGARNGKSNSTLIILMYAMDEVQKRVGKEKFEEFAKELAKQSKGN